MGSLIDLTGAVFGKLRVISRASNKGMRARWHCTCECGKPCIVAGQELRRGQAKSCGCMQYVIAAAANRTHGLTRTGIYTAWQAMKDRCLNPANAFYSDYGGRGIRVCAQWIGHFEAFAAHMGPKPSPKHQLDRHPNNDGNYEPGNVRWATPKENARKKRTSHMVEFRNERRCVADWGDVLGMPARLLSARLRAGWPVEAAFTTPVRPLRRSS